MVGALPAAVISDRYGRRMAMFVGAWLIILGTIISATANTIPQFTVGRFVLGYGITHMSLAAPAYAMEIAPPQWRGRCAGESNSRAGPDSRSPKLRLVRRLDPGGCRYVRHQLHSK